MGTVLAEKVENVGLVQARRVEITAKEFLFEEFDNDPLMSRGWLLRFQAEKTCRNKKEIAECRRLC